MPRHRLAAAAAITLLALTGCGAKSAEGDSKGLTDASALVPTTSEAAANFSRGTLGSEQVAPIPVPATNATGQASHVSIEVSCDTTKPGLVTLQSGVNPNNVVKYVVSNQKSEVAYPREQVQKMFGSNAQVVAQFNTQLSNTLPQENILAVGVGTEMEPDDHCHISAIGPRGMLVNEDVTSVPGENVKLFTFEFPPSTSAAEPPAALAPAPAAQGPKITFADGTHLVGTDIAPGTYRAPGGPACYFARLSDLSGEFSAVVSNGNGVGPIIRISESDAAFSSRNCGQWRQAE